MKLIVKPTSSNLWWGIYGLTEKVGWEDIGISYDNGKRIGGVCLNTKGYLRAGLEDLKKEPEEAVFVKAIETYLKDDGIHYWYYYAEKGSEGFYEVPYNAPRNAEGVKPSFIEIWHPHETIGIDTMKSAIKGFAKEFLGITDCQIQIENIAEYEEAVKSFEENEKWFGGGKSVEISFSQEVINELSSLWGKTEKEVLLRLNKALK